MKIKMDIFLFWIYFGGAQFYKSIFFRNLILAEYEDGHILGRAIYQNKMDKTGNLKFELLNGLKDWKM